MTLSRFLQIIDGPARLRAVFGIDLRTLALFRFLLGGVAFGQAMHAFRFLRAFYTDAGVLPRSWLAEVTGPWRFSLHFASGDAWWQVLLFTIAAIAGLALMLGWRARQAAIVSLVLLASQCARNPLVMFGGDYLMCCLLFWSIFLPVSARFSIDAVMSRVPPPADNTHLSFASAALTLQVLSVYFFSALLKTGQEWWPDGTAVYFTLSLDSYSWPWSHWLLAYPVAMKWLTWFVYWLEYLGPLVALSPILPRTCRFASMSLIMGMQLGFLFLLAIGYFPFVSLTAASALLGGWVWDLIERRAALGRGLRIYYDGTRPRAELGARLARTLLLLPRAEIAAAQSLPRAATLMAANDAWVIIDAEDRAQLGWSGLLLLLRTSPLFGWLGALLSMSALRRAGESVHATARKLIQRFPRAADSVAGTLLPAEHVRPFTVGPALQGVVLLAMSSTMAWNWATVGKLPFETFEVLSPVLYPLRLEQFWQMFAPYPFKDNGWYVLPGKLIDGSEVDVLHPRRGLSYAKPWSIAFDFPDLRWQVYENRLYDPRFAKNRNLWSRYLCREWNREASPAKRLVSFNIVYMLNRTPPPGQASHTEQVVLWRHECVSPDLAAKTAAELNGTESSVDASTRPATGPSDKTEASDAAAAPAAPTEKPAPAPR